MGTTNWTLLLLAAAAFAGCDGCERAELGQGATTAAGEGDPIGLDETQAVPEAVSPAVAANSHARRTALYLGRTLKERLQQVLGEEGPAAAVRVCSTEARALVQELESAGEVRVGRSSLRLRNPENAAPDWVAAWLREQGERPAEGVEGIAGLADGPPGRFVAPIAVEPVCLTCHGPVDSIPEEVRAELRERYPEDRAVGYAAGDLRGALWAESLTL